MQVEHDIYDILRIFIVLLIDMVTKIWSDLEHFVHYFPLAFEKKISLYST